VPFFEAMSYGDFQINFIVTDWVETSYARWESRTVRSFPTGEVNTITNKITILSNDDITNIHRLD